MPIHAVVAALRSRETVSDFELDEALFPPAYRGLVSMDHWTPIEVSLLAASLLAKGEDCRILDIGAGVGKFCIVGALTTRAVFVGVEQRASLVETARVAATRSGALRASFVHANALDVDFAEFDAFYLFNPFYEQIALDGIPIDETIEPSQERFRAYVTDTAKKLSAMRPGTRVVTYNGLGCDMPPEYEAVPVRHGFWREFMFWIRR
jgi:SAM-dependent methyltransferase